MPWRFDVDENGRTVLAGRPKALRYDVSGTESRWLVAGDYARERVDFTTVAKPRPDLDSAGQPRAMKRRQCFFARVRRLWLDDEGVLRVCRSESQAEKVLGEELFSLKNVRSAAFFFCAVESSRWACENRDRCHYDAQRQPVRIPRFDNWARL
jgi:hypothetical protein